MPWLLFALMAGAGLGKAVADATAHDPAGMARFGQFWDNRTSWLRKYKDYYGGDKRARFPGATTVFAFATDGWHLANAFMWACADTAFLLVAWPEYRWYAVGAVLLRRVVFPPVYSALRE